MLEFPYESFISEDDIRINGGYRLSECLQPDDTGNTELLVANALLYFARMIYDWLPINTRDEIYANPKNEKQLALAQFYQAIYVLENGDISSRTGNGDTLISLNDLRGYRSIAPSALNVLAKNGWLYRGGVKLC